MATERITIIVEEKGARIVQRDLKDIGSAAVLIALINVALVWGCILL